MEKRSGFVKIGEVLGHVPTAPRNASKHRKSFSKEAIFGGEKERDMPRTRSLDLVQKEFEKSAFGRKKMRGWVGSRTVTHIKTMSPLEVGGIYKFAIESTHGSRLMKFKKSGKM